MILNIDIQQPKTICEILKLYHQCCIDIIV